MGAYEGPTCAPSKPERMPDPMLIEPTRLRADKIGKFSASGKFNNSGEPLYT